MRKARRCMVFVNVVYHLLAARIRAPSRVDSSECDPEPPRISEMRQCVEVADACTVLGQHDGYTTARDVRHVLGVSLSDLNALFAAIGLPEATNCEQSIRCVDLCEAVVLAIPSVLGVAAPPERGLACLDSDCAATLDTSDMDGGNQAPGVEMAQGASEDAPSDYEASHTIEAPSRPSIARDVPELLRSIGGIAFLLFPAASPRSLPDLAAPTYSSKATKQDQTTVKAAPFAASPGTSMLEGAPVFGNGTISRDIEDPKMQEIVSRAVLHATVWITLAIRRIDNPGSWELAEHYFGPGALSEANGPSKPTQMLYRALHAAHNLYVRWGLYCCTSKTAACVTPGFGVDDDKFVLQVCPFFAVLDVHMRTQTIVHELTHFFGTLDHAYGSRGCAQLAKEDSRRAINNADSYKFFVRGLIYQHTSETGENLTSWEGRAGRWVPHERCSLGCGESSFHGHRLWGGGFCGFFYSTPSWSCQRCVWAHTCPNGTVSRWRAPCSQTLCCEELACYPILERVTSADGWPVGARSTDKGLGEAYWYGQPFADTLFVPDVHNRRASPSAMTLHEVGEGVTLNFTLVSDKWDCSGRLIDPFAAGDAVLLDLNKCPGGLRSVVARVGVASKAHASGVFMFASVDANDDHVRKAFSSLEALQEMPYVWLLTPNGGSTLQSHVSARKRIDVRISAGKRGYIDPLESMNRSGS